MDDTKSVIVNGVTTYLYKVDNESQNFKCEIKEEVRDGKFWLKGGIKREAIDVECGKIEAQAEAAFSDLSQLCFKSDIKSEIVDHKKVKSKCKRAVVSTYDDCPMCGKKYHSKRMKFHINASHGLRKKYICLRCSKGFNDYNDLQRHTDEDHLKMKNYLCSICSKAFIKASYLRKHIDLVHYKIKNVHCTVCKDGRYCANTNHCNNAVPIIKPYTCNICGSKFLKREGLRWHTRKSHKVLSYKCDICPEQRFLYKRDLKSHISAVHSDEKHKLNVNKCNMCGKEYSRRFSLTLHIKGVHDKAHSYKCAVCDKLYTCRTNLIQHLISCQNP